MINQDRWVNSITKKNYDNHEGLNQIDHDRWVNTISKKNTYNSVPKKNTYNSVKKYSLPGILFICGLIFVSVVKNETRSLQKEISNLQTSVNTIKFNLDQAILDNEVITSPENLSLLAKENLNIDLVTYKKSQIKKLNDVNEKFTEVSKIKKEKIYKEKVKNLSDSVKNNVTKRIEDKKTEIRKLQELYSNPQSIPNEIKTQVAVKIKEKKVELKNIYKDPEDVFTLEKIGRWGVVQVVKVFLGIPVIPGR